MKKIFSNFQLSGWEVQFDPQRDLSYFKEILKMKDYKIHIPNFFGFYGRFKYYKNLMSVYKGREIPRGSYKYKEEVPKERLMSIFGPLNQEHNLGKHLEKNEANKFIHKSSALFCSFLRYHDWHKEYLKQ